MAGIDSSEPTTPPAPKAAPRRPRLSRRKRWIFRAILLGFFLLVLEGISWLGITLLGHGEIRRTSDIYADQSEKIRQLLDPDIPNKLMEIHPVLGWRYAANFKDDVHQLNSKAMRSNREYSAVPGPDVLRVAVFGSSIVYCSEVDNPNAWPALMEAANSDLEVLNYGVGGYGPDQAYLRYTLEGTDMVPHVVILGLTSDEIRRMVNRYRRFLSSRDMVCFKPRFLIDDQGALSLLDCPVRTPADYERLLANPREIIRFGEHDYWYRPSVYENPVYDYSATVRMACWVASEINRRYLDPDRTHKGLVYNEASPAFRILAAVLEQFPRAVRAAGAVPLVVLLPEKESVQRAFRGGPKLYDPLLERLRERGVPYLDGMAAFRAAQGTADVDSWYAPGGHYSSAGDKVVADWLPGEIRKLVASHKRAGTP
jgi:hypothetical protein